MSRKAFGGVWEQIGPSPWFVRTEYFEQVHASCNHADFGLGVGGLGLKRIQRKKKQGKGNLK